MFWDKKQRFIDEKRKNIGKLKKEDIDAAILQLSSEPMHSYILSLIDELVRQGIYLSKEEQEGAKMFVKILGGELQKGINMKEKMDHVKHNKKMIK
mgnify:CR=1 FL=1